MSTEAPVAIEFANSRYAVRGRLQEGIGTVEDLAAWLRDHAGALGMEAEEPILELHNVNIRNVDKFVALRDAIRKIFEACVTGEPAEPELITVVNQAAAAAPRWPVLDTAYEITERTGSGVLDAARAALARDTMSLLAGPLRADLRACGAPGCVKYFVRDHPRREWCCDHCGNRARAARHYRRHRVAGRKAM
jgi:predicted RNA-binding Zn ribbon-like protein